MKKFLGRTIATIGAWLWENGGWTGDESYDDLKLTGKLGYRMVCAGLKLAGIAWEEEK